MHNPQPNNSAHLLICTQNEQNHWKTHVPNHSIYQPNIAPEWRNNSWHQDLPETLLRDAYEIVPCLSLSSKSSWGYQCTLEYETECGYIGSCQLTPIGWDKPAQKIPDKKKFVEANIDLWTIKTKLRRAKVGWLVHGLTEIESVPALFSLSLRRKITMSHPPPTRLSLEETVPAISQMSLRSEIKNRVCSPTCLSMLMKYHGITVDVYDVIAETYHSPTQLYGVWPANIRAANRYGLCGYLCHMPNWETAESFIQNSYPFVASIQYKRGGLAGAPIEETNGHLVIVKGFAHGRIFVNDPASQTEKAVARSYDLEEFRKAWFGGSAITYILFPQ